MDVICFSQKRLYKILFFLIFFIRFQSSFSLTSEIKGNNPEYAGVKLYIYSISDYITGGDYEMATCMVDSAGNFNFSIETDEIIRIHIPLGAILGYMYVEPGLNYQIILPPRQDKTIQQWLNPFYTEPEVQIGVIQCLDKTNRQPDKDINYYIYSFDELYSSYYNRLVYDVYGRLNKIKSDSLVMKLDTMFYHYNNDFFSAYRKYKTGLLKYTIDKRNKKEEYSNQYFYNTPVLFQNPAYMEFFHQIFDNCFLSFSNNASRMRKFEEAVYRKNYGLLKNSFDIEGLSLSDELKELIILNEIFLELKKNYTPQQVFISFIDSLYFQSKSVENRIIAENIRRNLIQLLPGYSPPHFRLEGDDGRFYSIEDFKGKYLYLCFGSIYSLATVRELRTLDSLQMKYNDRLQVVFISVDMDFDEVKYFIEKKKVKMKFLYFNNDLTLLKKYDIKAYPTSFLIGTDGRLVFSPAKLPSEGFELQFFQLLRQTQRR